MCQHSRWWDRVFHDIHDFVTDFMDGRLHHLFPGVFCRSSARYEGYCMDCE